MGRAPYAPTHVVPAGGLDAWTAPDGASPPAARLDPGLDVEVVAREGDWARIVCSNGWEAWVDGRRLEERLPAGGAWATVPATPVEPVATPKAGEPGTRGGTEIRGLSVVSLVGGVAIAGGSFLDWWSFGPLGVSAWDIPIKFLLTGKAGGGIDAGPVVVALALVLVVGLVMGRRLPSVVLLAVSGLAIGIAGAAVIRGLRNDPTVYPEIGLLLTAGGGILVATDGFELWSRRS